MLILTRKEDQTVVFPNCGIVIHVLGVQGRTIKLGFEAPREVEVLRGELLTDAQAVKAAAARTSTTKAKELQAKELGGQIHDLRNQLNKVTLAIHLHNELNARGLHQQAQQTLNSLVDNLADIDGNWGTDDLHQVMENSALYTHGALPTAVRVEEPRSQLRLLVVDDEPNERELLAGLLEMKGCQCVTAASGNEALEVMEHASHFDFALLDMHMPGRDGASTLRAIRANDRYANMKVFSVSGTNPSDVGATIGGDGFDGWLSKPLNPTVLWNHLQESCRRGH